MVFQTLMWRRGWMEALRICQPRAYQGVMRKLIEAKQ